MEGTSKPTRDIAEVKLEHSAGPIINVFANHWPSRSNPESDRIKAAETLRKRVDQILEQNDMADVLIMGDLNDFPDNVSVKDKLRAVEKFGETNDGSLLDTMWPIFKAGEKGSYFFNGHWETIDHVIISAGMLDDEGFSWKRDSSQASILTKAQLFDKSGTIPPRPNRTYSGESYHKDGISDHLPVTAVLEY